MGKVSTTDRELAKSVLAGTFGATGQSAGFNPGPDALRQAVDFNLSLWGTFVGTVQLERTFDGGTNWLPYTLLDQAMTFSAPLTTTFSEGEPGVLYRLNCTAYTSGTINYRLSR